MAQHPTAARIIMRRLLTALSCLFVMLGVAACGSTSAGSGDTASESGITINLGALSTDDMLPLWAAVQDGADKAAGLNLNIQTFMSAQDEITAVTAGKVDAIMTDMVVPVQLSASGTPMRAVLRMNTSPAGIVASAQSGITSLAQLAGVQTGCSTPTAMEYIYDKALTDAGVPADQIQTQELKNLSVRLQMLTSGQIKAAVLPWTLYSMAVQQGATPLLDEQQGGDYSSTLLAFRDQWLTGNANANTAITKLLSVWDTEVAKIDANPSSYQALLAQQAQLPAALATTYQVRQYPKAALPDESQFDDVVTWMVSKKYIQSPIAYSDLVWSPK